jgi:hypothetical protein
MPIPNPTLRSLASLLSGLLAIFLLSLATDALLHATHIFPPWGQPMSNSLFALALAYRIVYAIAGCTITARLAPNRPMLHALILGLIGVVLSTAATIATWHKGPEFGPHWYPLALIATSLPCAYLGAKLHLDSL